jgi:hypothetical protein
MCSSECVAEWFVESILRCHPIDEPHLKEINTFLPGVQSVSIALPAKPAIFPSQEHYVLQTCFNLDLNKQPCTGWSAVFSGNNALLAKTVYQTGKPLLCPAR